MKLFGHLHTITHHRHVVIRHCFKAGIGWQGLFHDLSKYSFSELIPGVRYYQGTRSPNEAERENVGYSRAWMHHKGRNRHHFEYWVDYQPSTRRQEPVKMPLRYVAEMFCDRVAAGKVYQGKAYTDASPLAYFLKGKPARVIHPQTSDFLEKLLRMLQDEGEEKTFRFLKKMIRERAEY